MAMYLLPAVWTAWGRPPVEEALGLTLKVCHSRHHRSTKPPAA